MATPPITLCTCLLISYFLFLFISPKKAVGSSFPAAIPDIP